MLFVVQIKTAMSKPVQICKRQDTISAVLFG